MKFIQLTYKNLFKKSKNFAYKIIQLLILKLNNKTVYIFSFQILNLLAKNKINKLLLAPIFESLQKRKKGFKQILSLLKEENNVIELIYWKDFLNITNKQFTKILIKSCRSKRIDFEKGFYGTTYLLIHEQNQLDDYVKHDRLVFLLIKKSIYNNRLSYLKSWFDANYTFMMDRTILIFRLKICNYYLGYKPSVDHLIREINKCSTYHLIHNIANAMKAYPTNELDDIFESIFKILIRKRPFIDSFKKNYNIGFIISALAKTLFHSGRTKNLKKLCNKFTDFPSYLFYTYQISNLPIKSFSIIRTNYYKLFNEFLSRYKKQKNKYGAKLTAMSVGALCGEFQDSLFFKLQEDQLLNQLINVDSRLEKLFARSFPKSIIVTHIPSSSDEFIDENYKNIATPALRKMIDDETLEEIKGTTIFPLDHESLSNNAKYKTFIEEGWLITNKSLTADFSQSLSKYKKPYIGISLHSSYQTDTRIQLAVPKGFAKNILSKGKDYTWFNIDPCMSREEANSISEELGVNFITPEFDMYNDFETLGSFLKALDLIVIPQNSYMDFAAAIKVKALVVSPLGTVKHWFSNDKKYVFSNHSTFIERKSTWEEYAKEIMRSVNLKISEIYKKD